MFKLKRRIPLLLIGVIILAAIFRILWLDKVPGGLSNDELDYILNAKAVFLQGSDISNTWNPLTLTTPKSSFPQAEIMPLVTFIAIGSLPLSLFYSKLIYSVISIGIVILLYLIAKKLIGEKEAIIVGIIASINPWLLFFGRTAYDAPNAVFFYLFGMYVLLIARGWKLLLAFPFFFLGFYSYIGTKLLLIPFATITIFYSWHFINKRNFKKQYVFLFSSCTLLLVVFALSVFFSNGVRTSEISNPGMEQIIQTTNNQRRLSIQTPLTNVFSNKYVVFTNFSLEKYINVFSPNFLFLHGDSKALFTLWEHGVFYLTDMFFLIIGLYFLFVKKRSVALLLFALILIAPFPAVISNVGVTYAIRAFLLGPLFLIFIGYGIFSIIFLKRGTRYRITISTAIIILYGVQLLNFSNIYFFRNPIYNSESFNFSSRVLMKYLSLQPSGQDAFVVNGNPITPFKQYLFYENVYTRKNTKEIAEMYRRNKFSLNNIHFITCEEVMDIPISSLLVYESGTKCKNIPKDNNNLVIAQLGDSGAIYHIRNDRVCNKYYLSSYISGITFSDLSIEGLAEKRFCEKYIVNYSLSEVR